MPGNIRQAVYRSRPSLEDDPYRTTASLPPDLVNVRINGTDRRVDPAYFETYITGDLLNNPFVENSAVGWCICRQHLKPSRFLPAKADTGIVIICQDCGHLIAATQDQKTFLAFSVIIHHSSKVSSFQRWRRQLSAIVTEGRLRGRLRELAAFLEFGVGRTPHPVPRAPGMRRVREQQRETAARLREHIGTPTNARWVNIPDDEGVSWNEAPSDNETEY